jgi:hypothetical protein
MLLDEEYENVVVQITSSQLTFRPQTGHELQYLSMSMFKHPCRYPSAHQELFTDKGNSSRFGASYTQLESDGTLFCKRPYVYEATDRRTEGSVGKYEIRVRLTQGAWHPLFFGSPFIDTVHRPSVNKCCRAIHCQ